MKYLDVEAEMRLNDLKNLTNENVETLRKSIGMLWHLRLGHASKAYLEEASKILPELKNVKFSNDILDCEDCKLAKITKVRCTTTCHSFDEPLHCVHTFDYI